ncbi:transposase [Stutzerimonas kirkiae]|nr:transposase [Stutzerimonas kirkiae]
MAMNDHNEQDKALRNLFNHPWMVRDLLSGFVQEDWVRELDFSTLEKVNGHYVSDALRERVDDLVWRVRHRGQWLYIYLLLEFQSRNDHWMALRMAVYIGLLYQDLIKTEKISTRDQLPPVFPLVIYNGLPRWRAPRQLAELVSQLPGALQRHQPSLRYFLLDENRSTDRARQLPENNVASLIEIEEGASPQAVRNAVTRLRKRLSGPEHDSLQRAFTVWLNRVILKHNESPADAVPETENLQEVESMLAHRIEQWKEDFRKAGMQEGREEGLEQGLEKGQALLLRRLLGNRFGPLPAWASERLDQASVEQVNQWAERLFEVQNLEELLAP